MRGAGSCAVAEAALAASAATTSENLSRMSVASFQSRDDLCRSSVVAFAHLVDESNGVLQQVDLCPEACQQAFSGRVAVRLCVKSGATLVDRLVDHAQVLPQRCRRHRI